MDKKQHLLLDAGQQDSPVIQTLVVDGCRVTVRYNSEKNPGAVSNIKSILLATTSGMKKCENLHN